MPTPRSNLAATVIDGKMYIVGGFGSSNVGVALEVYDPVLNTWSTLAPMPTSRGDLAASALNNKLFAVGGISAPGAAPLATVEVYTPAGVTSVDELRANPLPSALTLHQNFPNPFNPTTTIPFVVAGSGFVSLKVFNILGQEVATLVNQQTIPGKYTVPFNATGLRSGVYFYRLQVGDFVETKKLTLLR